MIPNHYFKKVFKKYSKIKLLSVFVNSVVDCQTTFSTEAETEDDTLDDEKTMVTENITNRKLSTLSSYHSRNSRFSRTSSRASSMISQSMQVHELKEAAKVSKQTFIQQIIALFY